jgi:hypothetical protein
MPQGQDLGFQLLSRLEVVAQHADEQETDAIMQRSCSDSPPAASHLDKIWFSEATATFCVSFFDEPETAHLNSWDYLHA